MAPNRFVAMRRPGRHHDHGAFLDAKLANGRRFRRHSRNERDGRVKPQCLPEHVSCEYQLLHIGKPDVAFANDCVDFGTDAIDDIGARCKDVKHPGQDAGGCFMSGQKEHADLINQLFTRKRLAGFRISCRNHCRYDVVDLRGVTGESRIDQAADVRANRVTGIKHALGLSDIRPGFAEDELPQVHTCHAALEV